jgi:hypothetical protein
MLLLKHRHPSLAIAVIAVAMGGSLVDAGQRPLLADGRLDARYTVSLGGLPIGYGSWTIDVTGEHLSASASGSTSGILQIFASGRGESAVHAKLSAAGRLVSSNYEASVHTDKKYDEVRMLISAGKVKEFTADPPTVPSPDRIPLTDAHRRGVSDPLTASLVRMPGTGEIVVPRACQRTVSVFDGRMRYDLQLTFKRIDRVQSQGYDGPVAVCGIRFSPVAGYVPERYAIKYLIQRQDMELWLAPIAGTRIMAPFKLSIPTPVGVGVLEATQFISTAHPGRASAKTQ